MCSGGRGSGVLRSRRMGGELVVAEAQENGLPLLFYGNSYHHPDIYQSMRLSQRGV